MRPLLLLTTAVLALAALGCNPEYPPPAELPAEYTACDAPEDCVVVELGCCDACNGGEARSVSADQVAPVEERYAEVCQPGTACTEIGCPAWQTTCEDNVCGLVRDSSGD